MASFIPHYRNAPLTATCVVAWMAIWLASGTARAGCGDYLRPLSAESGHSVHASASSADNGLTEHLVGSNSLLTVPNSPPRPKCDGPGCGQAPTSNAVNSITVLRETELTSYHLAGCGNQMLQRFPHIAWIVWTQSLCLQETIDLLFRPPRARRLSRTLDC